MSTAVQQAPGLYRTDIQTLEGTLEYQLDGHDPITVIAGEGLMVPAETLHSIRNTGDGNSAELATYVVEKGRPPL